MAWSGLSPLAHPYLSGQALRLKFSLYPIPSRKKFVNDISPSSAVGKLKTNEVRQL
jgi:hypothetical protein